jgi:cytochrome c oxidase subunit 2|tara:strand:- start:1154 stop:2023 length:870 start_codon:yes stop_codon:yes gene_type:complete
VDHDVAARLRAKTGRSRSSRALIGTAALALTGLALAGCTANEAFFFDLPEPASVEAPIIQNLWNGSWIAAWAVGIVTWGLMIWAAIAYRRRHANEVPEQTKYNLPLEALYTIVPLIMILGLFWFTARDQSEILTLDNDQQQTVGVVGFRWSWAFNYVDQDAYDVGVPYGEGSPGEPPTLYLPVDEKIRFELNSPDVIHSFWVPSFLFKMDVVPGKTNAFELTPDKIGTYAGKCAELCGVDHARMLFQVKVVERDEFDAKMGELRAKGQTGKLDSDRINSDGQRPEERRL